MRKVTIVFGLLAGVIVSIFLVITMTLCEKGAIDLDSSDIVGYGGMVIALSMIFFGIKSYRDNYGSGIIKFTTGLKVGLLITLVASVVYAAAGEAYYQISPDSQLALMDKYADHQLNSMTAKGASSLDIEQKSKEMADLKEMYKNPLLRFAMTLVIISPVGIVITLISAGILRKKEFLPA